jgi:hypothetical protein
MEDLAAVMVQFTEVAEESRGGWNTPCEEKSK